MSELFYELQQEILKLDQVSGKSGQPGSLSQKQKIQLLYLYKMKTPTKKIAEYFKVNNTVIYYHFTKFKCSGVERYEEGNNVSIILDDAGLL